MTEDALTTSALAESATPDPPASRLSPPEALFGVVLFSIAFCIVGIVYWFVLNTVLRLFGWDPYADLPSLIKFLVLFPVWNVVCGFVYPPLFNISGKGTNTGLLCCIAGAIILALFAWRVW